MPDPNNQVHDFNPGIAASGLFWTAAMPASAFDADPGAGRARFHAENLAMGDYHDIFNAVTGGPAVPGHVTFDVRWTGRGERTKIRDTTYAFDVDMRFMQGLYVGTDGRLRRGNFGFV